MTAEQRSPEWHKQRVGLVTGSSVGAILHLDPYATRDDVLRRMVREYHGYPSEFQGNIATEYGTNNEPIALMHYEREYKNYVDKAGFVAHENGWLGASPDGYIGDEGLIEIKCPYSRRKDADFISISEQPHYMAQIQVQLECTGREWCDFYQWSKHGHMLERVYRDNKWLDENLPRLKQFHAEYLDEINNSEHLEPIRKEINSHHTAMLLEEYDQLSDAISLADERKKEVLAELIELAKNKDALIHGRKLTQVTKKGSVSYAKVVKEHLPELDLTPYTGNESKFWKLT